MRILQRWWRDARGDMAETALVMPVVTLVLMLLITIPMTSWTATSANTIAQRAARAASVAQDPGLRAAVAIKTAEELAQQFTYGKYAIEVLNAGAGPGDVVVVRVHWEAVNWAAAAANLFPGLFNDTLRGEAVAAYRVEGW
ncbi:MAG: hypothetical protein GX421_09360 [Caldisericales bacterium]|nr:hypothetical protein [Caldisericales bacterium]